MIIIRTLAVMISKTYNPQNLEKGVPLCAPPLEKAYSYIGPCSQTSVLQQVLPYQWHSHQGVKAGRVPPLTAKNLPKIRKKRKKSGKRGKNWERRKIWEKAKIGQVLSLLPLLTGRAGYASEIRYSSLLRYTIKHVSRW